MQFPPDIAVKTLQHSQRAAEPQPVQTTPIKVLVQIPQGWELKLMLAPSTPIEKLKKKIEKKEKYPAEEQKLICCDRTMEDGKPLSDYTRGNVNIVVFLEHKGQRRGHGRSRFPGRGERSRSR
eukprot:gnl/MRDRNA2_/MRDRNA2_133664_c0_seq1.p1 gnl/MRDRNA2_/MRDRNA2_133664_c0~~gnl/MRDRNA2_/MRDRNA2_133664_c0_seq1.p1  ORF type:complete len:123 (+),score=13.18 gnl/MRDRNA2_/MRDRNA2_133664_c0_seq1:76-444(+)